MRRDVRIVSLVPSITLALHQLGLGDQIVGATQFCIHPAPSVAKIEKVGGTKDPDLQKIRALEADLVIANTDEQREKTLLELEEGPWDLLVTETDSLEDVADTWVAIAQAAGVVHAGEEKSRQLTKAIQTARQESAQRDALDVLVPVWKDPWMAAGGGTYLGDLLEACGMRNVLAEESEKWMLMALTRSQEEAQAQRPTKGPFKDRRITAVPTTPQAVLLPTEPYAFTDEHRGLFAPIGVPDERVFVVDGELLTWWLSHTVDALEEFTRLAGTIHTRLEAASR